MLYHLMAHISSVLEATVWAVSHVQSLICAIFLVEKHVCQSPHHSEALLLSPWCLLSPVHRSSFLRVFCEGSNWAFPLFISLPSLVWKEMTNKSFSHCQG